MQKRINSCIALDFQLVHTLEPFFIMWWIHLTSSMVQLPNGPALSHAQKYLQTSLSFLLHASKLSLQISFICPQDSKFTEEEKNYGTSLSQFGFCGGVQIIPFAYLDWTIILPCKACSFKTLSFYFSWQQKAGNHFFPVDIFCC